MSALKDLTGQRFGKLVVLRRADSNHKRVSWECVCDCGNHVVIIGRDLKNGHTKSCGKHRYKDLTGMKFGEVTAIRITKRDSRRSVYWLCKCSCGEYCEFRSDILLNGTKIQCKNHYVNTMIGRQFGELIVVDHIGKTFNTQLFLCKCSCGNETVVRGNCLTSGNTNSCGCARTSLGEHRIRRLLDNNQIDYVKNKTFDTCKFPDTNYPGYFDFYVDNDFVVEFDGKQHFEYKNCGWDKEDAYIKTHSHDLFKNQWAWEHGIPVKRIPFTERDRLTLSHIMSDSYLITPKTHPQWYPANGAEYPYI